MRVLVWLGLCRMERHFATPGPSHLSSRTRLRRGLVPHHCCLLSQDNQLYTFHLEERGGGIDSELSYLRKSNLPPLMLIGLREAATCYFSHSSSLF